MGNTVSITALPAWQQLQAQRSTPIPTLRELFKQDSSRAQRFTVSAAGLTLDYSKNLIDERVMNTLLELASQVKMRDAIAALFRGEHVNNTEDRPALHMQLRSPRQDDERGRAVHAALAQMEKFTAQLHGGQWRGHSGKTISDVVNIGIGGSDLGPAMVYAALTPYHVTNLTCHFVSNVDPLHLEQTLAHLNADTTLFVVASKTFTTLETMQNANAARRWALAGGVAEAALAKHFVAVSANVAKAAAFGIAAENIFPMWDWVGGRYSLWSAIGLPIALGIGMQNFRALLAGAHALDEHFRTAPLAQNLPVLLALLSLWYSSFHDAQSHTLLPYVQNLHLFPAFLQQLDMESLGKQVRRDAQPADSATGTIIWGSAGTNGQHSFHQLLHQGTRFIPADFIAALESHSNNREAHLHLLANCFAQSQALMDGKTLEEVIADLRKQGLDAPTSAQLAPHKVCPGNRPSNMILMQKLTPATLGALTALYEQKVFAQSVLLGINAFDQWGVELGKVLSTGIYKAFEGSAPCTAFDTSTNALVNRVKNSN
jgi:glucose-6-phosphate isomerase